MLITKYSIELKSEGIIVLALSPGFANTREKQRKSRDLTNYENPPTKFSNACRNGSVWFSPRAVQVLCSRVCRSPKESVEAQLKVINTVTIEESAQFLSHNGTKK
jgi:hypothetical protein